MLILIAVVIAVVAIAAMQMMKTAKDTGEDIDTQSQELSDKTSSAMKAQEGEFCVEDEDCLSSSTKTLRCVDFECR